MPIAKSSIPDATRCTLGGELDRAAPLLGGADGARRARALWAALTGRSPGEVWLARHEGVSRAAMRAFRAAVARCAGGEPMAYVVGNAGFRTIELAVDDRVLIPRPETEGLVEAVLEWCHVNDRWGVVADIGVGSGCVIVSLAVEGRFTRLVATDRSAGALRVAAENARRIVPGRVGFVRSDLLTSLAPNAFDVIVANPPYVTRAEYDALDDSVRRWEPRGALVSGTDGNHAVFEICRTAHRALKPGGLLALEIDTRRAADAAREAAGHGFQSVRIEPDLFGRNRFLLAHRDAS